MTDDLPICPRCGDEFEPSYKGQECCGRTCANKYRSSGSSKVTLECEHCGGDYEHRADRADRSSYCSEKCTRFGKRNGMMKLCLECGGWFYVPMSLRDQKCCDNDCKGSYMEVGRDYCKRCGKQLSLNHETGYCRECFHEAHWEDKGGRPECRNCGRTIKGNRHGVSHRSFCKWGCYTEWQTGRPRPEMRDREIRECDQCGGPYEVIPSSDQQYCGHTCSMIAVPRLPTDSYECDDGHIVRSQGERKIDNWLHENDIPHEYEPPVADRFCADWKVGDTYIEFWGMVGIDEYEERMETKKATYDEEGLELVEVYPWDLDDLGSALSDMA